jgi:tetratricopeptide (TPR) repeat protein
MDSTFEQLWNNFLTSDISVSASLEANSNRIKRRDLETITSLIKSGDREKAQAILMEVVSSTPVWNPLGVTTALKKVAEFFYSAGQYENAALFAERGLKWDPAHPELIALLCKSYLTLNPERSLSYYTYLKEIGYPESLLEGYTPPSEQITVKPYSFGLDGFYKINNENLFNLMVFQAAAYHRRPLFESIDSLRSHALCCIAGGHLNMALVAIRLTLFRLKDPLYISGLNPLVIQIKNKWAKALEQLVCTSLESDNKAKSLLGGFRITERLYDRKQVIEDLMNAKNTQGLFCFVMDPVSEISFLACQYLIEAGEEKKIKEYLNTAVMVEQNYKEIYGDLKLHLLLRLVSSTGGPAKIVSIASSKEASSFETSNDTDLFGDSGSELTTTIKKVVRKKAKGKDDNEDDDDDENAKKKSVTKKIIRKI